jgi:predicted molibdopterin-dependent oxidoreductase YjgC
MEQQGTVHQVTIDGQPIQVEDGTTILDAAGRLGIEIPHLCYHPALEPYGVCRVCIVEMRKGRRVKTVTACNFPIQDDELVIFTNSEGIVRDRRTVLELLLARCYSSPVVRDFCAKHGVDDTDLVKTEAELCTLCGRCVNVCRDLIGQAAIGFESRGSERSTAVPFGKPTDQCIGCGACVYVCPTDCIKMEDLPQDRVVDRWMTTAPLLTCRRCGKGFGTVRELELLKGRHPVVKQYLEECPECRERGLGESLAGKAPASGGSVAVR